MMVGHPAGERREAEPGLTRIEPSIRSAALHYGRYPLRYMRGDGGGFSVPAEAILSGKPDSLEEIRDLAHRIDGRYDDWYGRLQESAAAMIKKTARILQSGGTVAMVMPDGTAVGRSLAQGAVLSLLDEADPGYRPRSAIVANQAVTRQGYNLRDAGVVPATSLLGAVADTILLTDPNKTPADQHLPDEATLKLQELQAQGGLLLGLLPTNPTVRTGATHIMERPTPAAQAIMTNKRTHVLSMIVWPGLRSPVFEIFDLSNPTSPQEVHDLLIHTTDALNDQVEGETFVYNSPRRPTNLGQIATSTP